MKDSLGALQLKPAGAAGGAMPMVSYLHGLLKELAQAISKCYKGCQGWNTFEPSCIEFNAMTMLTGTVCCMRVQYCCKI